VPWSLRARKIPLYSIYEEAGRSFLPRRHGFADRWIEIGGSTLGRTLLAPLRILCRLASPVLLCLRRRTGVAAGRVLVASHAATSKLIAHIVTHPCVRWQSKREFRQLLRSPTAAATEAPMSGGQGRSTALARGCGRNDPRGERVAEISEDDRELGPARLRSMAFVR
jgi:hypothetical protein